MSDKSGLREAIASLKMLFLGARAPLGIALGKKIIEGQSFEIAIASIFLLLSALLSTYSSSSYKVWAESLGWQKFHVFPHNQTAALLYLKLRVQIGTQKLLAFISS